jgi:hypothetical protein
VHLFSEVGPTVSRVATPRGKGGVILCISRVEAPLYPLQGGRPALGMKHYPTTPHTERETPGGAEKQGECGILTSRSGCEKLERESTPRPHRARSQHGCLETNLARRMAHHCIEPGSGRGGCIQPYPLFLYCTRKHLDRWWGGVRRVVQPDDLLCRRHEAPSTPI